MIYDFRVTLTYDSTGGNGTPDTTINLHDYGGENLLLADGFSKEQSVHKDLKPVQDRAKIALLFRTSLARELIEIDASTFVYVDVNYYYDGTLYNWFYGTLRPITSIDVTGEDDSVINLEVLDNSTRLKRKIPVPDGPIESSGSTVSSIVTTVLDRAGYASSEYNVPTISSTIGYFRELPGKEYWKILSELLFSYGYVFYFDNSGVFQVYDFSVSSTPAISAILNDLNIVETLGVEREIEDYDGVDVEYYTLEQYTNFPLITTRNHVVKAYPTPGSPSTLVEGIDTKTVNFDPDALGEDYDRIVDISNVRLYLDVYRNLRGRDLGITGARYWTVPISDWVRIGARTDTWTNPIRFQQLFFKATLANNYQLTVSLKNRLLFDAPTDTLYLGTEVYTKFSATGDVYYTVKHSPLQTNENAQNPLEQRGDYIYSESVAQRLATILDRRRTNSQYRYTLRSEINVQTGDYVTLESSDLNTTTTARVIAKRTNEGNRTPSGALVYEYDLEGVAELGTLFGSITSDTISITFPPNAQAGAIESALEGLTPSGTVSRSIQGNLISGDFTPNENGLYFDSNEMGFYDTDSGWVASIRNDDGVGKFRVGSSDEFVEWDGDSLNISGNAQSKNYTDDGDEGWQLTNAGKLTAREGEIGGWTIQDTKLVDSQGRVYLNPVGRRVEIRDATDVIKIVLGYLGGISTFDSNQYGLYIAPGNAVRFDGGVTLGDGDTVVQSDAAITIQNSFGTEAGRFGSIGDGDIGLVIGSAGFRSTLTGGGGATSTMTDDLLGGGAASTSHVLRVFTNDVDGGGDATSTMTATVTGGGSALSVMTPDLIGGFGNPVGTVPATFTSLVGGGPASGVGIRYSQSAREITIRGQVTADVLKLPNLPRSSVGLDSGTVYRDGDTLKIKE